MDVWDIKILPYLIYFVSGDRFLVLYTHMYLLWKKVKHSIGAQIGAPRSREHWPQNSREQGTWGKNLGAGSVHLETAGSRELGPLKSREQGTFRIKFERALKQTQYTMSVLSG